jgi:hypothetical protein
VLKNDHKKLRKVGLWSRVRFTGDFSFSTGRNDGFLWSFRGALYGKRGGLAPRLPRAENAPCFSTLFFNYPTARFF